MNWLIPQRLGRRCLLIVLSGAPVLGCSAPETPEASAVEESTGPYDAIAEQIARAVRPAAGDSVLVRYHAETMPQLEEATQQALERAGAKVESLPYGPVENFASLVQAATAYVVLPSRGVSDPPDQGRAVREKQGLRQVHLHWQGGTMGADGMGVEHPTAYDDLYAAAIDIDHAALDRAQEAAIQRLRAGRVRITTPHGTDLQFEVGDRSLNKQNGDASPERGARAQTQLDLEIELPAGSLRVAPMEETVNGVIVIPSARFGETRAEMVRVEIAAGQVARVSAASGEEAARAAFEERPVLKRFGSFSLGFNEALRTPPGHDAIPYYGYGAGVVRLSLGNNTNLRGSVDQSGGDRSFYLTDATVAVGSDVLAEKGTLRGSN